MNLRQLKYFVRVAETANMTRAADELRIAQPALGMQIKQLEEELGVTLLTRHSRGVSLTTDGAKLLPRAIQILELVDLTRREVRGDIRETVRFGLTPSLMQIIGPELLLRISRDAPSLAFSLTEEMSHVLVDSLHRGDLDVILAYEVADAPGLWKRALYQEDLVFVTAGAGGRAGPVIFAEALAGPLVLPEPRDGVRSLVDKVAAEYGFVIRLEHEIRSISGIKAMIARGPAAGILPYGTVLAEVNAGTLSARPIIEPVLRRTLHLAGLRKARHLAALPTIREAVVAAMIPLSEAMTGLGHPLSETSPSQNA
ncbi:LysR family transcriptional regulator [Bosea sp. (in: a-proteobacteria)]|uniref:LysR family transcriptional regulator n=1 Tax=Bosea sp. (in: a-proteobacteria) TaxID=1871050 RepID=UPI002735BD81|nr:LysR family transcriptional regulator [Bosea sp. (in: a-proteobacteria)]MDP3256997.1 LysR family transcriptional regulator [Bosea sp. (in: a-proteobacteria)]